MLREQLQRYSRHVYFNEEDQDFIALCSEFPHLSAFGDTPQEALEELNEALEAAIEIHAEEGWPIPQPDAPPEPEGLPSGRFVTRLPRTLHAQLVRQAKHEGVSQNHLVMSYVAAGLGSAQHRVAAPSDETDEGAWAVRIFAAKYHTSLRMALVSAADHISQSGAEGLPEQSYFVHPPQTQDTSELALVRA